MSRQTKPKLSSSESDDSPLARNRPLSRVKPPVSSRESSPITRKSKSSIQDKKESSSSPVSKENNTKFTESIRKSNSKSSSFPVVVHTLTGRTRKIVKNIAFSSSEESFSSSEESSSSEERKINIKKKQVFDNMEDKDRERMLNVGKRKLITMINSDYLEEDVGLQPGESSKLTEEEKKKTMVPTNISREVLNQIFALVGSKGMANFMSLSSANLKSGMGMKVDLSDTPMTLDELKEAGFPKAGTIITGLHLIIPDFNEGSIVIPTLLAVNLQTLIISHTRHGLLTPKAKKAILRYRLYPKVRIEASMPKLTHLSIRKVLLLDLEFLVNSPNLTHAEILHNIGDFLLPLSQCTKLTHLYLTGRSSLRLKIISSLVLLQELVIFNSPLKIENEEVLLNFTHLRHFYISASIGLNLESLSQCKNLESFATSHYYLADLNGLKFLPQLRSLYLGSSKDLVDTSGLKYTPNLEALTMVYCPLINIEGINSCSKLEELSLTLPKNQFDKIGDFPLVKLLEIKYKYKIEHKTLLMLMIHFPKVIYLILDLDKMINRIREDSIGWLVNFTSLKKVWYNSARTRDIKLLKDHGITLNKSLGKFL